jgi:stage IV sporulation protein FB
MFNLDEPGLTRFDWRFRLLGTDVRVHPLFWIVILLLGGDQGNPWFTVYWVLIVFTSILVHEFGHLLAMRWVGDRGYIVLWSCGGLAISPRSNYRRSYLTNVAVCAAGPAAGLLLALLTATLASAAGWTTHFRFTSIGLPMWYAQIGLSALRSVAFNTQRLLHVHFVINTLLYVNFYWSLVNLLPIYPLDGGQMARAIFEQHDPDSGLRRSLQVSALAAGAVAVLGLMSQQTYLMFFFAFLAIGSLQTLSTAGRRPWRRY